MYEKLDLSLFKLKFLSIRWNSVISRSLWYVVQSFSLNISVSSVPPRSMSSIGFRQCGVSPTILNMASSKKSCEYFVQILVTGVCNFPKVC